MGFLFSVDIFISLKVRSLREAFVIQMTITEKSSLLNCLMNDQLLFSLRKVVLLSRVTGLLFHKLSYLALASEDLDLMDKKKTLQTKMFSVILLWRFIPINALLPGPLLIVKWH